MCHSKNEIRSTDLEIELSVLVQAALQDGKRITLTVVEIKGDVGSGPACPEDSTPCQEHCIEILREAGHRLTQKQILAALSKRGYYDGESTVKLALAQMSRDGRLT